MSDAVIPPPLSPDELGPDTSPVAYETALDGALAYVTLNRPDFRNAQNSVMTYSLDSAFRKAVDDPAVKVIVLRAAGKHFSAGHDIGTPSATSTSTTTTPRHCTGTTPHPEVARKHR